MEINRAPGQSSSNSSTSTPSCSSPTSITGGSSISSGASELNNSPGSGDQTHCDQAGYPSCYSVGYSDGLNAPGTSCPSGHSRAYCDGYKAGSISGGRLVGCQKQSEYRSKLWSKSKPKRAHRQQYQLDQQSVRSRQ